MYAGVVFDIPIDKVFDYRIPESQRDRAAVGVRVRAPFRAGHKAGVVVSLSERTEAPYTKSIVSVLDDAPLVDPPTLGLARWMADYYLCSWGEALFSMVPPGARRAGAAKTVRHLELAAPPLIPLKSARQARVVEYLKSAGRAVPAREILSHTGASYAQIKTLVERGIVGERQVKVEPTLFSEPPPAPVPDIELTAEQRTALTELEDRLGRPDPGVVVLHGVTGSGKTEIYLRVMKAVHARGRRSIFLVPEVALTPQTVSRVRSRFERVAVLHSTLTEADRGEEWRRARRGEVDVVVGARSAIFAPLKSLGLIVIDEEHEGTYKQDSIPRYHAREVAIERGRREGALVILGSATPSLESFHRAREGVYGLIPLTRRVRELPMPAVRVIDMETESPGHRGPPILSKPLEEAVRLALGRGEQVIVFLNRRGYSSFSRCGRCRWLARCRRCEIALNFHRDRGRWLCHYCMEERKLGPACPKCRVGRLGMFGAGTERVEQELGRLFPGRRIARMDSDSMKTREDYAESLGRFWSRETDILVGTQMIAKGLDVPDVTVVGVISADTPLFLPDFRAAERAFQLVTQVAGRAGRSPRGGTVFVQTMNPTHYSIARAAAYDFEGFARKELELRKEDRYPPYTHLVRILGEAVNEEALKARMAEMAALLRQQVPETEGIVAGPAPAALSRLKNRYRHHLLIKCLRLERVLERLARLREAALKSGPVHVALDVDPLSVC
jgi:primosomal protein N' (replication factor Y)